MTTFLFANNAASTLAAPINNVATSITLAAGTGALFPNPSAGQQFALTLVDHDTGLLSEICYCTARSGDVLTVVRAQEGTTALSWSAGDSASNFLTAGTAAAFQQSAATGIYYATDTGAANALVVTLSPVPANQAALVGVPIYVLVGHTTTAAAPTLNVNGFGAQTITYKNSIGSSNVQPGALVIGGLIQVMWDGTNYQLISANEMPAVNTLTDGYATLPNGTIIQWGFVTGKTNGSTVTLDITFPTRGVSVVAQAIGSPLGPSFMHSSFVSNSVILFNFYEWNGTGFDTSGTYSVHYVAIGY